MAYRLEFSVDAERDFELIFDHLFESYRAFGEDAVAALDHAEFRIRALRVEADRLLMVPHRGERHDELMPGLRHLTLGMAIYRFLVDEPRQRLRVLAVFFGQQDHVRHMIERLLNPAGS